MMSIDISLDKDNSLEEDSWRTALSFRNKPSPLVSKILKQHSGPNQGQLTMMFYGCGKGRNMQLMNGSFHHYVGYDLNYHKLKEYIPDNMKERIYDYESDDGLYGSIFNIVFCIQVLNTIPYNNQLNLLSKLYEYFDGSDTFVFEVRSKIQIVNPIIYGEGFISRTFADGSQTYQEEFTLSKLTERVREVFKFKNYPFIYTYRTSSSVGITISKRKLSV